MNTLKKMFSFLNSFGKTNKQRPRRHNKRMNGTRSKRHPHSIHHPNNRNYNNHPHRIHHPMAKKYKANTYKANTYKMRGG